MAFAVLLQNELSYLQKYRLYLSRIQKQNEARAFTSNLQQNSTAPHHNTEGNRPAHDAQKKLQEKTITAGVQDPEPNKRSPLPTTKESHPPKSSTPKSELLPSIPKSQGGLSERIPLTQLVQRPEHDRKPFGLPEDHSHLARTQDPHAAAGHPRFPPPLASISINYEKTEADLGANCKGQQKNVIPHAGDSLSIQAEHVVANSGFGPTLENNEVDRIPCVNDDARGEADLVFFPEDLDPCSLQNIGYNLESIGIAGVEMFQQYGPASLAEMQSNWYDELELGCDYYSDALEYPFADECLFAK